MTTDTTTNYVALHFDAALSLFKNARRAIYTHPPVQTDDDQDELDALVNADSAAVDYLMGHAAPDLTAVVAKLEIIAEDPMMNETPVWLAGCVEDLMRLAGIDRSPTFDPFVWAHQFENRGGKTSLVDHEGQRQAALTVPVGDAPAIVRARGMLGELGAHQRAALSDHLLETLAPEDFGLTAAA